MKFLLSITAAVLLLATGAAFSSNIAAMYWECTI